LAKLAEKLSKNTNSVRIAFKYGKEEGQGYMNINSGNSMILQKQIVSLTNCLQIMHYYGKISMFLHFFTATYKNTICQYNSIW